MVEKETGEGLEAPPESMPRRGHTKVVTTLEHAAKVATARAAIGLFVLGLVCVAGVLWALKWFLDNTI